VKSKVLRFTELGSRNGVKYRLTKVRVSDRRRWQLRNGFGWPNQTWTKFVIVLCKRWLWFIRLEGGYSCITATKRGAMRKINRASLIIQEKNNG